MARMITALFDSRADAEAARDRLKASKVDISGIHIVDKATEGYHADTYSTTQNKGIWGSIKSAFLPDEDRHTLEEGVHRGGFVLSGQVSDDQADNAVQVLDNANSIDLDKRSSDWHAAGWNPAMAASKPMPPKAPVRDDARLGATGDQMIPVYEEQLVVGKREVARGGARVRSYIVETPVHEQVRLREEHVEVERRPVNQPISATDGDVFRERTIAMTETAEEAAVGKTARVVEEISLRKEVGERTETVTDSVRRTEVEVERLDGSSIDRAARGVQGDDRTLGQRASETAKDAGNAVKRAVDKL